MTGTLRLVCVKPRVGKAMDEENVGKGECCSSEERVKFQLSGGSSPQPPLQSHLAHKVSSMAGDLEETCSSHQRKVSLDREKGILNPVLSQKSQVFNDTWHANTYACKDTCIHIHAHVQTHMHVWTHTNTSACMDTHTYTHKYICMHGPACGNAYMQVHTHGLTWV